MKVTSSTTVDVPAETVYAFLSSLSNHQRITGRRLRVESLAADRLGARIVIRGPLGLRRTARTTVTRLTPSSVVGGTASVGRRTTARVDWNIERAGAGSRVVLTATITKTGVLDRVLLALGGRWWLARSFDRAVRLLAAVVAPTEAPARTTR